MRYGRMVERYGMNLTAGWKRVRFGSGGREWLSGPGMDLGRVDLLIGSSGVFRHRRPEVAEPMLRAIDIGARTKDVGAGGGQDVCRYR